MAFKFLFVLSYFNFCPDFFGHVGKRIDKKGKLSFSIYDVIYWETKIETKTLPNISRSKDNQTLKLDQLIDYKVRNGFVKNHVEIRGGH